MPKRYAWQEDPSDNTFDVPGAPEAVYFEDAYTQWVMGWGRDFLPVEQLRSDPQSDPGDFDVSFINFDINRKDRSSKDTGYSFLEFRAAEVPRAFMDTMSEKQMESRSGAIRSFQVVCPLPLRRISVNPEPVQLAEQTAHIPADGTDPDKAVIVAVIDDAVNIFNERFTHQGQSRIDYAWIQDAISPGATSQVPFGREYDSAGITAGLGSGRSEAGLLHGFDLIRAPNRPYQPSTLAARSSHGTFVADMAAGYAPDDPQGRDIRMITVQLPALAVADSSGATLISAMTLAVAYVYDRAMRMSLAYRQPLPVVLNISFGFSGGPKTGQNYFERVLRSLEAQYRDMIEAQFGEKPRCFRTLPVGNDHLRRGHGAGLAADGTLDMDLRLQPEDRTASFVEIWLPVTATSFTLRLRPPPQAHLDPADLVQTFDLSTGTAPPARLLRLVDATGAATDVVARLSIDAPLPIGQKRHWWRVLLAMVPTRSPKPHRAPIPFGVWGLDASYSDAETPQRLHAWVSRDQDVSGINVGARQPYLEDHAYSETLWDAMGTPAKDDPAARTSYITRDGTISGFATHDLTGSHGPNRTISVAGIRMSDVEGVGYSASDFADCSDPLLEGQAPVIAAPCDRSVVRAGLRGTGTLSGSSTALNGTSVAAPIVARVLSQRLCSDRTDPAIGPTDPLTTRARPPIVSQERHGVRGLRTERLTRVGRVVTVPPDLAAWIDRDRS